MSYLRTENLVKCVCNPVNVHGYIGVHAWQVGPANDNKKIISHDPLEFDWTMILPGTSYSPTDQAYHLEPPINWHNQRTATVSLTAVSAPVFISRTQEVLWIDSLFPEDK